MCRPDGQLVSSAWYDGRRSASVATRSSEHSHVLSPPSYTPGMRSVCASATPCTFSSSFSSWKRTSNRSRRASRMNDEPNGTSIGENDSFSGRSSRCVSFTTYKLREIDLLCCLQRNALLGLGGTGVRPVALVKPKRKGHGSLTSTSWRLYGRRRRRAGSCGTMPRRRCTRSRLPTQARTSSLAMQRDACQ